MIPEDLDEKIKLAKSQVNSLACSTQIYQIQHVVVLGSLVLVLTMIIHEV